MSTYAMTLALPDDTGASRMAWQFGSALVSAGHRVILFHGPEPTNSLGGVSATILPAMRESNITTKLEPRLSAPWSPLIAGSLAKEALKYAVDGFIGVNQRDRCVAIRSASKLGVPAILCAQNQHRFWGPLPLRWAKRKLYQTTVANSDCMIVCTSSHVQREFVEGFGAAAERTVILQNAVPVKNAPELSATQRQQIRVSFGCSETDFMWVNVGRLDYQKGQDVLLGAAALLKEKTPDWRLVLVGDVSTGANQKRMEIYYQDLVDRVQNTGLQENVVFAKWRDDVPELLQASDGYVHTARYEGSPLAVIEAMSATCPIVTVDNASRPEGFEDQEMGLVAEPNNPADIAEKMGLMMDIDAEQRQQFGARARTLAMDEYDIETVGRRFCKLVEDFCESAASKDATISDGE